MKSAMGLYPRRESWRLKKKKSKLRGRGGVVRFNQQVLAEQGRFENQEQGRDVPGIDQTYEKVPFGRKHFLKTGRRDHVLGPCGKMGMDPVLDWCCRGGKKTSWGGG